MKKYLLALLLFVFAWQGKATATNDTPDQQLDSMELHASLLVVSPGKIFYTMLGHCSIRMEAYSEKDTLDYCYTLECEAEENMLDYLRFVSGKVRARWMAVTTETFLAPYEKEHRTVTKYELPYSYKEKQELWQRLDEAYVSQKDHPFNYLSNNCTHGVINMLCQGNPPRITIEETKENSKLKNGALARQVSEQSPWMQFLLITMMGSETDIHWPVVKRATPKLLPEMLKGRMVDSEGNERVMIAKDFPTQTLIGGDSFEDEKPYWLSPNLLFTVLLMVSLIMLLIDWCCLLRGLSFSFDLILFTAQCLFFVLLFWLTQISGLFGHVWNWYLLPLFPLPILLLSVGKRMGLKQAGIEKAFSVYTLLLLLFILATPLSSQLDFTHQLITATVAVRSFAHSSFFFGRRKS